MKKFKLVVSAALEGTFTLSFLKEEGNEVFYNDIPEENITISLAPRSFLVHFGELDLKSIGVAIEIPITFEMETSETFALVYDHNCTNGYTFSPASVKQVPVETKNTSISIVYNGTKIPKMCVINFELSELTDSYELEVDKLYISAYKSIDRESTIPPMRLRVTKEMRLSESVGDTVLQG